MKKVLTLIAFIISVSVSLKAQAAPTVMSDGGIFDPEYYARNNHDVVSVLGTNPETLYSHYVSYGSREGRAPYAPGTSPEASVTVPTVYPTEEEMVESFFTNSLFIGDSIMNGFSMYRDLHPERIMFKSASFLAIGNYSSALALGSNPVHHPSYKGEKRPVWESAALIAPARIFINLGINDLVGKDVEAARNDYVKLLSMLRTYVPGAEIVLVSCTPMCSGRTSGYLNNANIRAYNVLLEKLAAQSGMGYVNVADVFRDTAGNLDPELSNDGFVHLKIGSYIRYESVLRAYAVSRETARIAAALR